MIESLLTLGSDEEIALVAIVAAASVVILPLGFKALRTVLVARSREKTRRELAAYVAEGSISADQAVAFLRVAGEADAPDRAEASDRRCGGRRQGTIVESGLA